MFIHLSFLIQLFLESSKQHTYFYYLNIYCHLIEQKLNFCSSCMVQSSKSSAQQSPNLETGKICWNFVPDYFFSSTVHKHTEINTHIKDIPGSPGRSIQCFNIAMNLDIFIHFLNLYSIIYCIIITIMRVGFQLFSTIPKTHHHTLDV